MSWNGTVRCSWCNEKGHNKRTCPHRIAYAELKPDTYIAKQLERERKRNSTPRSCSYCGGTGHNRRSCPTLKQDKAAISSMHKAYKQKFVEQLSASGLGVGSLVKRIGVLKDYDSEPNRYEIVAMVTGIIWENITVKYSMQDFVTGRGDTGLYDRRFLDTRVVSIKFEDEESAKISREKDTWRYRELPKVNGKLYLEIDALANSIPEAFPNTDFEKLKDKQWVASLIAKSGCVNPPQSFMNSDDLPEDLQKYFNFVVHGNTEWEKERTSKIERYLDERG